MPLAARAVRKEPPTDRLDLCAAISKPEGASSIPTCALRGEIRLVDVVFQLRR